MDPLLVVVTGLPGTGKSTVAESAAALLDAPVLAHDWAMSGLRPYPEVQTVLDSMQPSGHRTVGWCILCALAQAHLRRGRSVILDGVARTTEVERFHEVAQDEGGRLIVILTECADPVIHRSRIEGRQRSIPNWYELDWDHVQQSLIGWDPPDLVDLSLQATDAPEENTMRLAEYLQRISGI
jgi:predicted kinase